MFRFGGSGGELGMRITVHNISVTNDEQMVDLLAGQSAPSAGILSEHAQLVYLFDNVPELVYLKDTEGRYLYANAAIRARLGRDPTKPLERGLTIADLATPEAARQVAETERRIIATGEGLYDLEEKLSIASSQPRWYRGTRIPIRDDAGKIVGIAAIIRDITEVKRQELLRRGHAALMEMIVHGEPLDMIIGTLAETVETILEGVQASVLLFEEQTGRLRNGASPSLPQGFVALLDGIEIGPRSGSCGTAAWRREAVFVSDILQDPLWADHTEIALRYGLRSCWSTPIIGAAGVLLGTFAIYCGTVREPGSMEREVIDMATNIASIAISRRRAEDLAQYMAHHDPLTGLYNRNLFWSQFSRALHEARREDRMVAVTYLDLDNFKEINDKHGHAAGDEVLCRVAERIKSSIRVSDIAVRLGGDEFAIIFSNPSRDEAAILRRLEVLRQRIAEPVTVEDGAIDVTCSLGVAFYTDDRDTPELLLAKADAAMYAAKNGGRNRVQPFQAPDVGGA